ncbi:MAG: large-conductance mechanosensitive channel protein MscL [Deltaproteobacteria bacterium]|nr:large-conductance mechanosensitive channel protein MscL [Deltaproteobacteria bacterium]
MSILKEFKDFAAKGNVVDMAVGIVIGASFTKIVSSFVSDVIMPPLGFVIGGVNFTGLKMTLKEAAGNVPAVTLNYGTFLQTVFDFTIVAFAMFMLVKAVNKLHKKGETAPKISGEEVLLGEIRDILKAK